MGHQDIISSGGGGGGDHGGHGCRTLFDKEFLGVSVAEIRFREPDALHINVVFENHHPGTEGDKAVNYLRLV